MRLSVLGFVCLASLLAFGEDVLSTLRNDGLLGKISVLVSDSKGRRLAGIPVRYAFLVDEKMNIVDATTDKDGLSTAEARVNLYAMITVKKEGYYKTSQKYTFFCADTNRMVGGRWQPWNPTINLTLMEQRKPKLQKIKRVYISQLCTNALYGFDIVRGDVVKPYGIGTFADFSFFTVKRFWSLATMTFPANVFFRRPMQHNDLPRRHGIFVL